MLKKPVRQSRSECRAEGGTNRISCGPLALAMGLGERKSPLERFGPPRIFWYVEGLNDARTLLADFFNILLGDRPEDAATLV
jgi:hypothetical protein